ncbi:Metallo-dependent phosphatase-like protein [Hysterangium stoloniferum]|nr:Metallo-dependent phosphatase-like protein [Hysterangium stoloniferum]
MLNAILWSFIFYGKFSRAVNDNFRNGPSLITPPSNPLVWGDVSENSRVLNHADTHGWLAGHTKLTPPEPNYSADFGMFSSFVTHMKVEAERRGVDLLLVDSGDLHDGNGLTDGFLPGDVNGHEALKIFAKLPYDVLAIGNHELYKYEVVHDVYKNFVPKWGGRYLTSNVNITVADENGQPRNIPLGDRFAKFKTARGRSITAFGVLFHFTLNTVNTTVQRPEDMVQESWFQEVISDEPDVFLLVGQVTFHMSAQGQSWPAVFNAIRAVHPHTPILIFGGHTHIRDCLQFDGRSMTIASGQYMETVGAFYWLDAKESTKDLTFTRRYLDANLVTYLYHTGLRVEEFNSRTGLEISAGIEAIAERFDLAYQFGTSPDDFFRERVPRSHPQSLLSLVASEVIPIALTSNNPRASIPAMFVANSGFLRSDLYKGPFTRNDQFVISPFTNDFEYISNVSSTVAEHIVDELNNSGLPALQRRGVNLLVEQGDPYLVYQQWMHAQWQRWNWENDVADGLTLGYVTKDACPGTGDDVTHAPLPYYPVEPFMGSDPPAGDSVDLIFVSFIRNSVLQIVNTINAGKVPNVTAADVKTYSELRVDQVLGVYAELAWN